MTTWEFRIWFSDSTDIKPSDPTEELIEWSNRLYEAGCDDSSPGTFEGRAHTDFHRDAETLNAAIRTAVADVHKAGLTIDRIEIPTEAVAAWAD